MSDNVAITAGSGTTIAADDLGAGVLAQRVKPVWGADGTGNDVNTTTPLPVEVVPKGGGGATKYYLSSAASTNAAVVKASAGVVYGIQVFNTNASVRYLRFYNKASAPTVGSDTVVNRVPIPGNGGAAFPCQKSFTTGIAISLTTGAADTNTSAVALDEITVNIDYV